MKPQSKQSSAGDTTPGRIANQSKKSGLIDNETRPQHTPGPWRIDSRSVFDKGGAGERASGHVVADVPTAFSSITVRALPNGLACPATDVLNAIGEANARLIAAAPDLLEALKAYQDETQRAALNATRPRLSVLNCLMRQASLAIAKAEGSPE